MPTLPTISFDEDNIPMKAARDLVSKTRTSFFLTGKAGTGKTTFIRNIFASVDKHFIILAPTGIAALSAGGQTIHHYLGLPLGVLGPDDYGMTRIENINELRNSVDAIIIDEVSMVRCDVMDAIDRTLRHIMRTTTPFGGFQMIFIGDLYQLEPVVTDNDRDLLFSLYETEEFHFFNAKCMDYISMPKIELSKMYRQRDMGFIDILGRIREGKQFSTDIEAINSRQDSSGLDDDFTVTLTSVNKDAARLNEGKLAELPGESIIYRAKYEGDCDSIRTVVDDKIELKVGAKVMFLKNDTDGHWVNGTVGKVIHLTDESVQVITENGEIISVQKIKWPVVRQEYNKTKRRTENKEIGAIYQLPLRLAWSVTIHKSQSMTFDRLRIDMGRGAFCCGQAYVALSRAKSLGGIFLNRELHPEDIIVSSGVRNFSEDNNDNEAIAIELAIAKTIDDPIRLMNFDFAAKKLLEMSFEAAKNGNIRQSSEFLQRMFSTVVNDRQISLQIDDKEIEKVANNVPGNGPAFLFYGGKAEAALAMMEANYSDNNDIDMLYLRLRCYEAMNDKSAFINLAEGLLVELSDYLNEGLPTSSFRKILFTVAYNWKIMGVKTALQCIDSLLDDTYMYKPLYSMIRSLVMEDSTLWLFMDMERCLASLSTWDDNEFIKYINKVCIPERWKNRFDPFFKSPFLSLSECLFKYRVLFSE